MKRGVILVDPRVEMPYGQLMVLEASKMGYRIEDADSGIRLVKE